MAVTNLQVLREERGETQRQAATALGLSLGLYGPVESGRAKPTARVAAALEKRFGYPIDVLLQHARVVADKRKAVTT
jgi:transcriptional regulator with XRE-family HTH domain